MVYIIIVGTVNVIHVLYFIRNFCCIYILQTALNMLCKLLHNELKDKGVHVGCLHPGWVQTDMGTTKAPLTISQSVCGCLQVMSKMNAENACVLTDYTGKPLPWWSRSLKSFLREFHGYFYVSQKCIRFKCNLLLLKMFWQ